MSDHVYRTTEVIGSSGKSIDDAIRTAITTAGGTVRHLEWFEVKEVRGAIKDNEIADFQVVVKLGFLYER